MEMLICLKVRGKISAQDACILAFWATNAGAVGVESMASNHGNTQTGHYSRKLDKAAGLDLKSPSLFFLDVPQRFACDGSRTNAPLAALLPFEALAQEVDEDDDFHSKLEEATAQLPPAYHTHEVVAGALPQRAIPLALYIDGIQYANETQP